MQKLPLKRERYYTEIQQEVVKNAEIGIPTLVYSFSQRERLFFERHLDDSPLETSTYDASIGGNETKSHLQRLYNHILMDIFKSEEMGDISQSQPLTLSEITDRIEQFEEVGGITILVLYEFHELENESKNLFPVLKALQKKNVHPVFISRPLSIQDEEKLKDKWKTLNIQYIKVWGKDEVEQYFEHQIKEYLDDNVKSAFHLTTLKGKGREYKEKVENVVGKAYQITGGIIEFMEDFLEIWKSQLDMSIDDTNDEDEDIKSFANEIEQKFNLHILNRSGKSRTLVDGLPDTLQQVLWLQALEHKIQNDSRRIPRLISSDMHKLIETISERVWPQWSSTLRESSLVSQPSGTMNIYLCVLLLEGRYRWKLPAQETGLSFLECSTFRLCMVHLYPGESAQIILDDAHACEYPFHAILTKALESAMLIAIILGLLKLMGIV